MLSMDVPASAAPRTPPVQLRRRVTRKTSGEKEPELGAVFNRRAACSAFDKAAVQSTEVQPLVKAMPAPGRQLKRQMTSSVLPDSLGMITKGHIPGSESSDTLTGTVQNVIPCNVTQKEPSPARQLRRRISEKTTISSIMSPAAIISEETCRRELKRRISEKTPNELVEVRPQETPRLECEKTANPMAVSLTQQILANGARLGRQRRLLAWLRERAQSGIARFQGRIVLESDIDDAILQLQKIRASARPPKPVGQALNQKKRSLNIQVTKDVQERCEDDKEEETSDDSSDSDSSSDSLEGSTSSDSDLSAEEEVDQEIQGNPGILKDLMMDSPPQVDDANYVGDWSQAPPVGSEGFSDFSGTVMRNAGVPSNSLQTSYEVGVACPPLQPHQETAVFLIHPKSPCTRVLVDHPTGSGKTREMIQILDNFFFDPRPKIPIFPKEPVCQNFYAELLRWPSKYRDFFGCMKPVEAARAAGVEDWTAKRGHHWNLGALTQEELKNICKELRVVLEMKGYFYMGRMRRSLRAAFFERFPNETCIPAAPLRALRYTSAGGRHTHLRESDGLPASALLKIGFDRSGQDPNVYSNKVVIMDEVHNLVRTQTQFGEQLKRLRELLRAADGAVVAGFTGTPILSEPCEGRQLLDIIKGSKAIAAGAVDEGFVSSFHMRPAPLFPLSLPRGLPDAVLTPNLRRQFVKKVTLTGEPLQRYEIKRSKGLPVQRLRAYCNMCVYFGNFHDGKTGSRARILNEFSACAPKLDAIVHDVVAETSKALVLVARSTGMSAVLAKLREMSEASEAPFGVATMDELAAYNSEENMRGERYRVMVADASSCSEGVSFFAVRRVLLADVPANPSALVQAVGRAIRMHGHRGLTVEEQTVTTTLYVARLPSFMRSSLAVWAYHAQPKRDDPKMMASKTRSLLRTLWRVRIRDLESLKTRLDAYASREQQKNGSDAAVDMVGFLESIGLWEEAKRVRTQQTKPSKRARRASTAEAGSSKRHYLVRALQALLSAGSNTAEAIEKLRLSPMTADEQTLTNLAGLSREIVPALVNLRSTAADRSVLAALLDSKAENEDVASDGASSACDFEIGDSSGGEEDEETGRTKKAPLTLPPGWHVRRFQRGTWAGREFVDESGNVYRSEQQARKAIDDVRRKANMVARHAALGARLRARQEQQQVDALMGAAPCAQESPESSAANGVDEAVSTTASGECLNSSASSGSPIQLGSDEDLASLASLAEATVNAADAKLDTEPEANIEELAHVSVAAPGEAAVLTDDANQEILTEAAMEGLAKASAATLAESIAEMGCVGQESLRGADM